MAELCPPRYNVRMFNPHPALSGLPLAFVGAAFVLEILLLRAERPPLRFAATIIVIFALLSIVATYLSGYLTEASVNQAFTVKPEAIEAHHNLGTWLLLSAVPWGIFYFVAQFATHARSLWRALYRILLMILLVLVLMTGFKGGQLVFEHGAGVSAGKETANNREGTGRSLP